MFRCFHQKCKCGKDATMLVKVMEGKPEPLCDKCWQEEVERGRKLVLKAWKKHDRNTRNK